MQNSLLIGLSREMALRRELGVVANNIANVDTIGFKADGSLFQQYLDRTARGQGGTPISFVRDRATWLDMSDGPIEHTGNPLDLAVDGKGFFAVQTPQGVRYTRNGSFQLNAQGQIVTADGYPLLGDGGPIQLQPNDHQIEISRDGIVSVREGSSNVSSQRGELRLVSIPDVANLQKQSGTLFKYLGKNQPQTDTKSSIIQGALEKSNVKGVLEMTRMIEITRSYEQVAAMLASQANLSSSAVDKLAALPA